MISLSTGWWVQVVVTSKVWNRLEHNAKGSQLVTPRSVCPSGCHLEYIMV
jgi:hypothetical protein